MLSKLLSGLFSVTCGIGLIGCAASPKPPSANGGLFRQKNEGYSILYKLMSDESQVGRIFIIKHADDSVGNLIRGIGDACATAGKQMDEFPKSDNRIEYDVSDLPYVEVKSRELAASETTKALLGSSGKEFELRLIFSQAQAMDYAHQLCESLAADDDNPDRKNFLTDLSQRCSGYYSSLISMLDVKP
jgi:hypothetical protein